MFDNRNKPYDPKKSVWMADGDGSFLEGLLQSDDGKKAVVMVGHEVNSQYLIKQRVVNVCYYSRVCKVF